MCEHFCCYFYKQKCSKFSVLGDHGSAHRFQLQKGTFDTDLFVSCSFHPATSQFSLRRLFLAHLNRQTQQWNGQQHTLSQSAGVLCDLSATWNKTRARWGNRSAKQRFITICFEESFCVAPDSVIDAARSLLTTDFKTPFRRQSRTMSCSRSGAM